MSRSTQLIGHTNAALDFITNLEEVNIIGEVIGMFGESVYTLHEYFNNKNGETYKEFIQFSPWSSGPMIFLALKNIRTGEILGWKEDDSVRDVEYDPNKGLIGI